MKLLTILAQQEIKIKPEDLNLQNGPQNVDDAQLATIFNTVYMVAGIVAVIVIIVGGIRYASSNGDASGVKSAKNTVLYAVVGLIVIIMAATITNFVISNIAK